MKKIAGYLNLKPINGIIFPSYIQNQLNKDFIETKLKSSFFMTTNENTYGENSIVLKSLIKNKSISGIVMLSTFCLPNNYSSRREIYKLIKKNKKSLHFIFEELNFKKEIDENVIESYLIFDSNFFTQKKTGLNTFEKTFVSKNWQFI
jgi:sporadic carbohydrate cluster protein (TIGR04323 family)